MGHVPTIALQGSMVLSGIRARVFFRSRARGNESPTDGTMRQVDLVPHGELLRRSSHLLRVIPSRSRLSLRLTDAEGRPLTEALQLGYGPDGVREGDLPFAVGVIAFAWLAAREW